MKIGLKRKLLQVTATLLIFASAAYPADVLIVGDTDLKPVSDVVKAIIEAVPGDVSVMSTKDVKEDLSDAVQKENAKVVVALGKDAVNAADALPESVPVIYGLVIKPPETKRQNITGVYMATPVSEYVSFINRYFPDIKKVGVICEQKSLGFITSSANQPEVEIHSAENPYEFVKGLSSFRGKVDALLLLPEKNLISSKAVEEVYLFSFANKIPVIGISEKYVKTGSLFSLVFDEEALGRQIGRLVVNALTQEEASSAPSLPPGRFKLYINKKTAAAMNITIPAKLLETAQKVY
ncbi:MAG: hypothetical protein HZA14_09720 [Nitrospirae bacterium]|nr:hypothetical protein [Nitrospirota bacterium]